MTYLNVTLVTVYIAHINLYNICDNHFFDQSYILYCMTLYVYVSSIICTNIYSYCMAGLLLIFISLDSHYHSIFHSGVFLLVTYSSHTPPCLQSDTGRSMCIYIFSQTVLYYRQFVYLVVDHSYCHFICLILDNCYLVKDVSRSGRCIYSSSIISDHIMLTYIMFIIS